MVIWSIVSTHYPYLRVKHGLFHNSRTARPFLIYLYLYFMPYFSICICIVYTVYISFSHKVHWAVLSICTKICYYNLIISITRMFDSTTSVTTHLENTFLLCKQFQFQIPCLSRCGFLIYRWLMAIFLTTWIILSGVLKYDWYFGESNRIKWFIYLTDWSFLLLTLDSLVRAILCSIHERIGRLHI